MDENKKGKMNIKKENTMALDLSLSRTGVVIFNKKKEPILVKSIETDSSESLSLRLRKIADGVMDLAEKYSVAEVVAEQGFFRYVRSSAILNRVLGAVMYVLHDYNIHFFPSSTIKKFLTNKGNASKEKVLEAVLKRYPNINFENLDESDACAVGITFFEKGISEDE